MGKGLAEEGLLLPGLLGLAKLLRKLQRPVEPLLERRLGAVEGIPDPPEDPAVPGAEPDYRLVCLQEADAPAADALGLTGQRNTCHIKISIELCLFKSFGTIGYPFDETVRPRLVFAAGSGLVFSQIGSRVRTVASQPHHLLSNLLSDIIPLYVGKVKGFGPKCPF